MFVRKRKNKSGSTSIQIIQKVNRNNRVIKTIGSSSDPKEIEQLYLQALYEVPRLYGPTLFDLVQEPSISELTNDSVRIIGPELIFGKIYDRIGFNIFQEPLLRHMVISRITHPGSKLQLSNYLSATGEQEISVYSIYRFMDKLNSKLKDKIEDVSFNYTKKILGGKIGVVFYDVTTIYFEASETDDYRITGFSKDGKHQNPQILLGLLVGKDGYPIGYEIFEGNTFEGHTLITIIQRYIDRFKLEKPIVIADSGLLSRANINLLVDNGFKFILGARIKNEKRSVIDKILGFKFKDGEIKTLKNDKGLIIHIGYSEKRARKDHFNRERGIKRLEKNILSGRLTKNNINNRGYNKFLKMEGEIAISINKEKLSEDQKWDGLKGYITNTDLSSKEILDNYNNLWKIEKAFRISKTDLKIRPIYHRLRERVEAHICISFMAYLVYKEFERIIKSTNNCQFSINQAIDKIKKMYELRICKPNTQPFRLKNNEVQNQILSMVNQNF
jgi:transposase